MSTVKPQCRWFAFSLRTLFVVLTIFSCWLGWEFHVVRERQEMLEWIKQHRGNVTTFDEAMANNMGTPEFQANRRKFPSVRRLFGDEPIAMMMFFRGDPVTRTDIAKISELFSEASVACLPFPTNGPGSDTLPE